MPQPEYVPLVPADRVRAPERLPPHPGWRPSRPAEICEGTPPQGPGFGVPGPDQGYGLKLARLFEPRLQLTATEDPEDAGAGCVGVGLRRAALFGRAPVIYDLEHAFTLWGFLGGAPSDLVAFRRPLFEAASHDYWDQREIVDRVQEASLRLTPAQVRQRLSDWRQLLVVSRRGLSRRPGGPGS